MKNLVLILSLVLVLSLPVSARGVYNNNTVYNLSSIVKITKHSSNTVTLYYIGGSSETLKFKNKIEAKKFFDAVSVVLL